MLLRFAEICSNHDPSGVFSASGDILCFSVVVKASAAGIIGKADSVAMVAGCERVAVVLHGLVIFYMDRFMPNLNSAYRFGFVFVATLLLAECVRRLSQWLPIRKLCF